HRRAQRVRELPPIEIPARLEGAVDGLAGIVAGQQPLGRSPRERLEQVIEPAALPRVVQVRQQMFDEPLQLPQGPPRGRLLLATAQAEAHLLTEGRLEEPLASQHIGASVGGTASSWECLWVRLFCGNLEWSDLGHLTLLRRGLGTGSGSGISPFA